MSHIGIVNKISEQSTVFLARGAQQLIRDNKNGLYSYSAYYGVGWKRKKITLHNKAELLSFSYICLEDYIKSGLAIFRKNNMQRFIKSLSLSISGKIQWSYQFLKDFSRLSILCIKIRELGNLKTLEYLPKALKFAQDLKYFKCKLGRERFYNLESTYISIFESLMHLTKLKTIVLEDKIGSEALVKWQKIIKKYPSLTILNFLTTLSNNFNDQTLAKSLQNAVHLKELDIRYWPGTASQNNFFDYLTTSSQLEIVKIIIVGSCYLSRPTHTFDDKETNNIKSFTFINELTMGNIDDASEFLSIYLSRMKKLEHLEINISAMIRASKITLISLSEAFKTYELLKTFIFNISFAYCIDHDGFSIFSESLAYLKELTHLNLDFTRCLLIGPEAASKLVFGISFMRKLQILKLNFSKTILGEKSVQCLSNILLDLVNLEVIDLSLDECGVGGVLLDIMASGLKNKTKLKNLKINFSWMFEVNEDGLLNLCTSLKAMVNLEKLNLNLSASLGMTDKGAEELLQTFYQMKKLKSLTFQFYGDKTLSPNLKAKLKFCRK